MDLLLFFILPISTMILAGIFETLINCPFKIAGITFAIYLIVSYLLGGTSELNIATIVYTFLAFIVAWIVMLIKNRNNRNNSSNSSSSNNSTTCNCRRRNIY